MTVQFIEVGGEKLAVLPVEEYDRLLASAEDAADVRAAVEAGSRREAGEEYLPAEMVDRLLAGEAPLRVWRKHRRMTLNELGSKAEISFAYLSQIETGKRDGTARCWRNLANALGVTVDEILPHSPA